QYLHLPGILQALGYRTIEIGVRAVGDLYELNMWDGFDRVNGRGRRWLRIPFVPGEKERALSFERAFLLRCIDRVADRLMHLAGIREMYPFLDQIMRRSAPKYTDFDRLEELKEELLFTETPLFAHVH